MFVFPISTFKELKKMIRCLFFITLLIHSALAQKPAESPVKKWLTLDGNQPLVIARGGFSGIFPESSQYANQMAVSTSLADVILFCNLQLTKDGIGICQPDVRLDNSTNIGLFFPKEQKKYNLNGQAASGWFSLDFTADQLFSNVSLAQNIFTRPSLFDGQLPISTVEDVTGIKPPGFWLNVQYDSFYTEHKLSMATYVQKALRFMGINYLSSPEIEFLKTMSGKVNKARTKLIFQFLDANAVEPTTKQTYGSILKNLALIKPFVSGILVPKGYIWPVNANKYLEAATSLVTDAHKEGLEVYASGFANDIPASYNYSYDPTTEYLKFIDNSEFSVDGVLTDFPPTASEAIACFAQNNANKPSKGKALVISRNGASGDYAGSTDLAYQKAVDDGADIIDCSVQISKDGVVFCMDSPDLMGSTTAVTTLISQATSIPEIQSNNGVFSFDLTWTEIQSLKPQIESPYAGTEGLQRNPGNKNSGKFVTLSEFLEFAKAKAVSGILIDIRNAAYLASNKGLDLVDAVTTALRNATFDKQSTQQVLIQSDDSAVLTKFANVPAYTRVLYIEDVISDAPKQPVDEIKKYANAVNIPRRSVLITADFFTLAFTNVVKEMKAANLSVYVSTLKNEFVALAFDFFSDPVLEIATYVAGLGVDGVVTEFPATASKYMRSPCSDLNAKIEYSILPIEAGSLLGLVPEEIQPPAAAPAPPLDVADVVDPPLPPVVAKANSSDSATAAPAGAPSGGLANAANIGLSLMAIVVFSLLSM